MTAPNKVTLIYRKVGERFIFTCSEIKGLHYAIDDINGSLGTVFRVLNSHASAVFGQEVTYKPEENSFSDGFCKGELEAA